MNDGKTFNELPFGLIELDTSGTVLRYSPVGEENARDEAPPLNLVGCNLFKDVAPIAQVREFNDRFQVFLQSPLPAEIFNLTFNQSRTCVHARVLLAQQMTEHQRSEKEKLVLVHLTRV